jgi:hypothetical protein
MNLKLLLKLNNIDNKCYKILIGMMKYKFQNPFDGLDYTLLMYYYG